MGVELRFGQQVGGVGAVAVACVAVEADDVQIYWCPVNLYERPYKRRVLGKRIEGVASDGMPWKKNPPPWKKVPTAWKKVPTAACVYGAPPRRK